MRAFVLLALLGLASCVDAGEESSDSTETDSETSGEVAPIYEGNIELIFENNCVCHFSPAAGGDMTAPYLNLNGGVLELVDVDSVQLPTMKRVAPGEVDDSYLVHKLRGTHGDVGGPADTDPMPPLAPLSEVDIARIEAWIVAGASP